MKNPMAAVRHYIDAFNLGDQEGTAAFAMPGPIFDRTAPRVWHEPTATWAKGKQ